MKKTALLLCALAVAATTSGSAGAYEIGRPPKSWETPSFHRNSALQESAECDCTERVPAEICNKWDEMKQTRRKLRAELQKSCPDRPKALRLFRRGEKLRAEIREWQFCRRLDGKRDAINHDGEFRCPRHFGERNRSCRAPRRSSPCERKGVPSSGQHIENRKGVLSWKTEFFDEFKEMAKDSIFILSD